MLKPRSLHSLFLAVASLLMVSVATAQTPPPAPNPAPTPPPIHDPTGCANFVEVRGKILEGWGHEFFEDGWWEMWDDKGDLVGWGTWEQDPETGKIDYENLSGDGGGGQTGSYEWDSSEGVWDRTEASHPQAPPMRLVPPL